MAARALEESKQPAQKKPLDYLKRASNQASLSCPIAPEPASKTRPKSIAPFFSAAPAPLSSPLSSNSNLDSTTTLYTPPPTPQADSAHSDSKSDCKGDSDTEYDASHLSPIAIAYDHLLSPPCTPRSVEDEAPSTPVRKRLFEVAFAQSEASSPSQNSSTYFEDKDAGLSRLEPIPQFSLSQPASNYTYSDPFYPLELHEISEEKYPETITAVSSECFSRDQTQPVDPFQYVFRNFEAQEIPQFKGSWHANLGTDSVSSDSLWKALELPSSQLKPSQLATGHFKSYPYIERKPRGKQLIERIFLPRTRLRSRDPVTRRSCVAPVRSFIVRLLCSSRRLQYLAESGVIYSVPISLYPGDPNPRYTRKNELGQGFSHFGRTRLLSTWQPGKKNRVYLYRAGEKMGPSYRNSNRRQNRPIEHDVFEGLPVRQWRKENISIVPPPSNENSASRNDIWDVELPHGMPKDSHMLPQHSQDLLRAARSGKIYGKRPAPVEEEEVDPEVVLGDKPEKKEDEQKNKGYSVKTWKLIPRNLEGPDIDYLAPRRKNLKTISSKPVSTGATLMQATVKRTDATGAEYTSTVVVPHGQQIEGEVISQTTIPDPNAQVVDPYAAPTPPKRIRPSKKKPKGPGRGRKKKIVAPTSAPAAALSEGAASAENTEGANGEEGTKVEGEAGATPATNEDVEMADGSVVASDDEEDDGEEGDDDEGSVSGHGSPSKGPRPASPVPSDLPTMSEIPDLNPTSTSTSPSSASPIPPLPAHLVKENSDSKAGSPLKNVALASTPLTSPTATAAPPFSDAAPVQQENVEAPKPDIEALDQEMQDQVLTTAPPELPLPPPDPTILEAIAAAEVRKEEEEEEEMLLDILESTGSKPVNADAQAPVNEPEPVVPEVVAPAVPAVEEPTVEETVVEEAIEEAPMEERTPQSEPVLQQQLEPAIAVPEEAVVDDQPLPSVQDATQVSIEPPSTADSEAKLELPPEPQPEPQLEPQDETKPEPQPEPQSDTQPDRQPETAPTTAPEEDEDDFPDLLGGLEKSLNKPAPAAE